MTILSLPQVHQQWLTSQNFPLELQLKEAPLPHSRIQGEGVALCSVSVTHVSTTVSRHHEQTKSWLSGMGSPASSRGRAISALLLIDSDMLNGWRANPGHVGRWNMVCSTPSMPWLWSDIRWQWTNKGKPVVVYGASFVYIPSHQAWTSLSDALAYLASCTEDCIVLVSTPAHPMFSPQPQQGKYYTLLPINSDPSVDWVPVCIFAAATLLKASWEGQSDGMVSHVKLLPCFGLSRRFKTELIEEPILIRGPLWSNTHHVEWDSTNIYCNRQGKLICQEVMVSLGAKIRYTCTGVGFTLPLTLMVCKPNWEDYLDLTKMVNQMGLLPARGRWCPELSIKRGCCHTRGWHCPSDCSAA